MTYSALSRTDKDGTRRRLAKFMYPGNSGGKEFAPGWYWIIEDKPWGEDFDPTPATDHDIRSHYADAAERDYIREYGVSCEL